MTNLTEPEQLISNIEETQPNLTNLGIPCRGALFHGSLSSQAVNFLDFLTWYHQGDNHQHVSREVEAGIMRRFLHHKHPRYREVEGLERPRIPECHLYFPTEEQTKHDTELASFYLVLPVDLKHEILKDCA